MKAIQKKCEKLENKKKKWKQEVVNLNKLLEMNVVEFGEVEQYKRKIEERARQDVVEKLKEVNLFLQVNLLILMCFHFTVNYIVCIFLLPLIAVCFVGFWRKVAFVSPSNIYIFIIITKLIFQKVFIKRSFYF